MNFKKMIEHKVVKMKNKINQELKEWAQAKHGRCVEIARSCGVSKGTVYGWIYTRNGIAPRHHPKIREITGIEPCAVEKTD